MEWARLASPADAAELARLWDAVVAEVSAERGGPQLVGTMRRSEPSPPPAGLGSCGDDPDRLVLVGLIDDAVVGFATGVIGGRPEAPTAVIEALYVEADARGVGVGEALMDAVVSWAEAAGCVGVDAPALPGSRAAKAFLEEAGFVTRLLTLHRPLPARR
jgi:GNAT superfamily N-acetyltransferase